VGQGRCVSGLLPSGAAPPHPQQHWQLLGLQQQRLLLVAAVTQQV
jgi:hypothetical protein